jgi:hypothetical protein
VDSFNLENSGISYQREITIWKDDSMRIWDINPGYLNRQSLLGEHRELHGIVSIIVNGKKGYANHPETIRWVGYGWSLRKRHQLLVAEMSLRGFHEKSPVLTCTNKGVWPKVYIDEPAHQYKLLETKYKNKEQGRIPLPENAQQLWSHHKYSVLARDVTRYKMIGRNVSTMKPGDEFSELARMLVELLREQPTAGGIRNALQHMWGYVSDNSSKLRRDLESWSLKKLFDETQRLSLAAEELYLISSTALSELKVWIPDT